MSSAAEHVLGDLDTGLRTLGVRWYLFGAQAALLRGSRRLTADVDVTIFLDSTSTESLVAELQSSGFDLRVPDSDGFVAQTMVVPLVHRHTQMPVDLVLGAPGLEEHFLSRCELLPIGRQRVPVPTAEDLIVMKLLAGREKDLEDASALVKTGADLEAVLEMANAIAEGLGEDDIRRSFEELKRRSR